MFRMLHTADWHVGRTLHRRQRLDETRAVLAEIAQIAEREQVDLVLVAGDVFEHQAPSPDSERVAYDALMALRATGAEVLVISGNHDNPRRLAAVAAPFAVAGVQIVPDYRPADSGAIIELTGHDGTPAQVACVPWVAEHRLHTTEELMGVPRLAYDSYAERVAQMIRTVCAGLDLDTATVFVGHLCVSGARLGGGDDRAARELMLGEVFAAPPETLPDQVSYLALGHIHRPQTLRSVSPVARYAGSPMALDFGEIDQDKSVTLIDLEPGQPAVWREIPITCNRRLVDVRGTLEQLADQAPELEDCWLRATVVCSGPTPGLADRVREILPDALVVRPDYTRVEPDPDQAAEELRQLTPGQLFGRYHQTVHGALPDPQLARLFEEIYEEVAGAAA